MTEEPRPSRPRAPLAALAVGLIALIVALAGIGLAQMSKPAPPAPQDRDIRLVIAAFEPHDPAMMMGEVHMFFPSTILANKGDRIRLTIVNMDEHRHGFELHGYGVRTDAQTEIAPGEELTLPAFTADQAGVFEFDCNVPYVPPPSPTMEHEDCGEDHNEMKGAFIVQG